MKPNPNSEKIRIAVVGAGFMGRLHASKVAQLGGSTDSVEITAVVDIDESRAREVAVPHGARFFTKVSDASSLADAAIIAVPTSRHGEVALEALRAGLHVLVEKPIAHSLSEAHAMEAAAVEQDRVLFVGHQEWLNPALHVALQHVVESPRLICSQRANPFVHRNLDVCVVLDLMVHDIHMVQFILGDEPRTVTGLGTRHLTSSVDIAQAKLEFACGTVAQLSASRIAATRSRCCSFHLSDSSYFVDFLRQTTTRMNHSENGNISASLETMSKPHEAGSDILTLQLEQFLNAVRNRRVNDSARGAIAALRTASRICKAIETSSTC